jgi:hypothetical protein
MNAYLKLNLKNNIIKKLDEKNNAEISVLIKNRRNSTSEK